MTDAFLVQILVPLPRPYASTGRASLERIKQELTARFGGVTAYTRGPAEGLWRGPGAASEEDDIVVVEVMTISLDRDWWAAYRRQLEDRLRQKELVIRASPIERL
ncbi:MAG: hypothetical protein AB7O56_00345 [Bauldia sp.]